MDFFNKLLDEDESEEFGVRFDFKNLPTIRGPFILIHPRLMLIEPSDVGQSSTVFDRQDLLMSLMSGDQPYYNLNNTKCDLYHKRYLLNNMREDMETRLLNDAKNEFKNDFKCIHYRNKHMLSTTRSRRDMCSEFQCRKECNACVGVLEDLKKAVEDRRQCYKEEREKSKCCDDCERNMLENGFSYTVESTYSK